MIQIPSETSQPRFKAPDAATVIVVVLVIAVGLVAMMFARRLIDPLDGLLTTQACSGPGNEVFRPVEEVEPSNRFALVGRSQGWCLYGPVDVDEATEAASKLRDDEEPPVLSAGARLLAAADPTTEVQLTVPGIEPGGFYRVGKWMGLLLQLGAASVAVRMVADPLLDRFVRRTT